MSRERWFHGGDETAAFDWHRPARDLDVPIEIARSLYVRAMRLAIEVSRAEMLYLRWLREAATARRSAALPPVPFPGRQSRVTYEASSGGRTRQPAELERLGPGKWTQALLETGDDALPGADDVKLAISALVSGGGLASSVSPTSLTPGNRQTQGSPSGAPAAIPPEPSKVTALRDQLRAAAETGHGAAAVLAAADPATAAAALHELRGQGAPILQLVMRAADGEVERVMDRGLTGASLPGDLAAPLGPHVTPDARLAQTRGAFGHALGLGTSENQQSLAADHPLSPQEPTLDQRPGERRLPAATLGRMERVFGQRFGDVEFHTDSAEVPSGVQAFTRGRHIYLEPGAFEPDTEHGEHVIAHELAHVAQQSQSSAPARPATRAALEADAHQAALAALAGRAASVSLFAPASAALGFSKGEPPPRPTSAPGAPSTAQSARGSAPAPAPRTPRGASGSPGGTSGRPAPTARPAATNSKTTAPAAAPAPPRAANGDGLLVPEAPGALTPAAAGRLQSTQASNQGVAAATTTLPTAQQQTTVAREAVVEPQAEQDGRAQHGVVTDVDDRPPPSPEIEEACAHIRQVIRDKRPPDEDKLVEAKPREMAQEAGKEMSAGVEQRAGTVRKGYDGIQNSPQGTPSTTPVPATVPPERAETQPVDAGAGTPDPVSSEDVSLDGDVAAQNQKIEDAGMNTEPGKLVEDGPIGDARGGAEDLGDMAKTDPQKVLADQAAAITNAKGDMVALQAAAEKALADARSGAVSDMGKHNTGVKGSEEQQRAQAGEKMKGVFTRTQQAVDQLLQPLSGNAVARWDAGVAQLSSDFEASLADVKQEIDKRHSGVVGFVVGVSDTFTGLPESITIKYDIAEAKFAEGCTSLIKDISRDVNAVVEDCKKLIELARKEIDDIVHSLPASLQTWAQGEAAKLGKQLDQLDQRVDQTQKSLNQDLIGRANGAVQEVRERVAQLRVEAGSFLSKIAAALVEFAKDPFKAIVNGLLRVLGIPPASFWSMVDRLGDVVGAIAKDPVKFGKTLISGAAQGFKQFFEHFPTHLKEILMGWLFGTMGTAGVPMPTDFSGPGIMVTVLGIVGIDTSMISSMLGVDGSDPAEMAEVHQELAGVLSGDPHALVALLRDHFDPASLIPMIKEAAMSFLLQALIMQVAPRIAAMLVPGGAILQAVEAIFKVLMWVVSNAARIFTLIESLVATAGQAVAGNVSGVAAGVESGLVQIIVLVIDFLAGYIGLGGLGAKLKGVIMKVSGKLKGALKKALDAIKKRAKAKAKTKHDQHKPAADKKPDGDKSAPQHPKQDDRDPQNAKDDAKDPRNHQHDPDDKDPRNHKHDPDDKDPRNHKQGDERKKQRDDHDRKRKQDHDNDPSTRKPDKDEDSRDDDKKKDEESLAEKEARLRRAVEETKSLMRARQRLGPILRMRLALIRRRYRLTTLKAEAKPKGNAWEILAAINPTARFDLFAIVDESIELRRVIDAQLSRLPEDATFKVVETLCAAAASDHLEPGHSLSWQQMRDSHVLFLLRPAAQVPRTAVGEFRQAYEIKSEVKKNGQTLVTTTDDRKYVYDSIGQLVPQKIVRNITRKEKQNIKKGISATDSHADIAIWQHVTGTKPSKYISATKEEDDIENPHRESFTIDEGDGTETVLRATINLFKVPSNRIYDLSQKHGQNDWGLVPPGVSVAKNKRRQAFEDTIRTQEVLIRGEIPRAAIEGVTETRRKRKKR